MATEANIHYGNAKDVTVSGTTDKNSITYKKKGNVVTVSIYSYYTGSTGSNEVTGLPKPIDGAYILSQLYKSNGTTIGGCIEYMNNKWTITNNTTASIFGSFTYIADE